MWVACCCIVSLISAQKRKGEMSHQKRLLTHAGTDWPYKNISDKIVSRSLSSIEQLYLDTLEMAVTGSLYDEAGECHPDRKATNPIAHSSCIVTEPSNLVGPHNIYRRAIGLDWPTVGHTMIGHVRIRNFRYAIDQVVKDNVPGDVAELGVWRGGAIIYAKGVLRVLGQEASRRVHVFDAFGKIPKTGRGYSAGADSYLSVPFKRVRRTFQNYGLLDEHVTFHQGLFEQTVPAFRRAKSGLLQIAVLRIDGNFYSSYQTVLYNMYEFVPVGGFLIFDDVGVGDHGVMRCWKDFKREQRIPDELIYVTKEAAYFRKTVERQVDWHFFRNASQVKERCKGSSGVMC